MRGKLLAVLTAIATAIVIRNVYLMLMHFPDEAQQGGMYRILFFHVPAAFNALLCPFIALLASIAYLVRKDLRYDSLAVASTEVGLAFSGVFMLTGMIWARIIWGVWWAWDARLTSALVLVLLYGGYMILRQAIPEATQRAKLSAVMSVFAAADVPIVWFSIEWWRTQHPQPVLRGGGSIDPEWRSLLYVNWLAFLLLGGVLIALRMRQEQAQRRLESIRQYAHAHA